MSVSVQHLYASFRKESGSSPVAIRMHPEDWQKLVREVGQDNAMYRISAPAKLIGMRPLIDPSSFKGFPICLDQEGRDRAISAGAQAA